MLEQKDWTGNKKTMGVTLGASNHTDKEREINDFYATDPNSVRIFLNKLKADGVELHNEIWEQACGQGHISEALKEYGYNVKSTDLINRGYGIGGVDFLKNTEKWNGDFFTNPPFKYAEEFIEKSIELADDGRSIVMFLKIQFLESQGRYELFKKYPPKYVYVNSSRQLCAMNGEFEKYHATALCYCWYIFEKGFTGETVLRWIK